MNCTLTLILLILTLTGCLFNDNESARIKSPTGNFEIKTTVNRANTNSGNHADVIIHLLDKDNKKLSELNTGAGDANKWTMGWTEYGDTVILQSSDIGNKAWMVVGEKLSEIKMSNELNERAEFLKSKKYE